MGVKGGRGVTPLEKCKGSWMALRYLLPLQEAKDAVAAASFFFGPNVAAAVQVVPGTGLPESAEAFLVAGF